MAKRSRITGRPVPRATKLCQVLTSDTRRRILIELADGPANVSQVAKAINMTVANTSVSLGVLFDHDLVELQAEGTQRIYNLTEAVDVAKKPSRVSVTINAADSSKITLDCRV